LHRTLAAAALKVLLAETERAISELEPKAAHDIT
jgi:hypothetical protein